jgi:hypothetical protein
MLIDMTHIAHMNTQAFSEQEIIIMNELLLTVGHHTITLQNKRVGCQIVDTFLSLLNCYQYIYWLGLKGASPVGTINLYDVLQYEGCLQDYVALDNLISTQFYPSCLVIEASDALKAQAWYANFYTALKDNYVFEAIPVIHLEFVH